MTTATRARVAVPTALWISVLALLTAVAPLATDMYLPALPRVATDLGASASAVQVTLTAFLAGLAVGQLVIGPLSDGWGRRRLLLAGATLCLVAGVAAALAPSVAVLGVARFLQGFGGAAGVVLSRAVISDRTTGDRTVRLFSVMMAINGIAPVVAPLMGSGLLPAVGWRGILAVVAGLALLMLIGAFVAIPETLPVERRSPGGLRRTLRDVRTAVGRRRYVGYTLAFSFAFATMFAYISGSPFVLQQTLGLPTGGYALAFGVNALGLAAASLTGGRLVGRVPARVQLACGIGALLVSATAFLVVVLLGAPRWPALAVLFLALCSVGFVLGNGAALASAEVRDIAGTGSALLGALQFGLGAAVSPLVGSDPLVMAVAMVVTATLAVLALATTAGRPRSTAAVSRAPEEPGRRRPVTR